jgi:hypothetical protein
MESNFNPYPKKLLYQNKLMSVKTPLLSITFLILVANTSFAQQAKNTPQATFPDAAQFQQSTITYKIIDAEGNTYGYDIYTDGNLMIHQPTKPGMAGNRGFDTKEAASKMAALVVSKIKKGEMPPSVSAEEVKKVQEVQKVQEEQKVQ